MGPVEILARAYLTNQGGGRTWQLSHRCGMTVPNMRSLMLRLERRGLVKRHERYSAVNDIYWVLTTPGDREGHGTERPQVERDKSRDETPLNPSETNHG